MPNQIDRLTAMLSGYNLDCLALIPGSTLRYLTDLSFHVMERPIVAFFPVAGKPAMVAPEFECTKIANPDDWRLFPWRDEDGVEGAFAACCDALALKGKRVGVEELVMRVKEYSLLKTFAPQAHLVSGDALITAMRVIKTAAEIARMKEAIALAETVLQNTLSRIKIGITEKDVAAMLLVGLLEAGSQTVPFEPLVQTGITGASPHAGAGDRKLTGGDLLIVDFGARAKGYVSDITRTFAVGRLSDEARKIYDTVRAANRAGREAAGPGVACQAVDQAARRVIEQAGYGQYFTHRTGHGLGMDGHEPPFIVDGNAEALQPGMTFTVEPGIYIAGLGGVRVEDDMVITAGGAESLTTFSRNLISVG